MKDGKMVRVHRERVDVVARFGRDGTLEPVVVLWKDGRRFLVDEVIRTGSFGPVHHGRCTMVFDVRFGGHETQMFLEHRVAQNGGSDQVVWWVRALDQVLPESERPQGVHHSLEEG